MSRSRAFVLATLTALATAGVATLPGCDKAGSKASGALAASEAELLKHLPADTSLVLGGNYMKLQQLFTSSQFAKLTRQMVDNVGKGLGAWMDCYMGLKGVRSVVGVSIRSTGAVMNSLTAGVALKALAECADKGGFKPAVDADGKFFTFQMPSPAGPVSQGYLQLDDGALYSRQTIGLGGGRAGLAAATRAELEADQADVAKANASTATKLQAVIAKADRSKTAWFAGAGAGTPIGDKVGELYGSLDLEHGMGIVVNAELLDQALAQKIEEGVKQAKQSAAMLPPMIKGAVERLELTRDGARVRAIASLTESELEMMTEQIAKMAGAAGAK